jgi:hypothetical protein
MPQDPYVPDLEDYLFEVYARADELHQLLVVIDSLVNEGSYKDRQPALIGSAARLSEDLRAALHSERIPWDA